MTDKGLVDKVKGNVKEAAGDVTGDDKLKAEGFIDKAIGVAKEAGQNAAEIASGIAEAVHDTVTDALDNNKK